MVTHLVAITSPGVDMHMLKLDLLARDARRHVHVVELLRVHVEQVRVPLLGRQLGHLVQVQQARLGHERLERRDEGELVEVASRDDRGRGVFGEDRGDEGLGGLVSITM